jgi:GPH family glycoside/pentoside/hexuronide:cation symporter
MEESIGRSSARLSKKHSDDEGERSIEGENEGGSLGSTKGEEEVLLRSYKQHHRAQFPPLSFVEKLTYGIGDISTTVGSVIYSFFLQAFLLEVADVDVFVVGILLLVGQLWDAFNDPVIGHFSDLTTSSMGRRRPWLLYGTLPFALAYFLLWQVPPWSGDHPVLDIFWHLFTILLYNTAFTCLTVPYRALTPDLTRDYDERTTLTTFRQFFALISGLLGVFVHSILIEWFDTYRKGYTVSAIVFTAVMIFPPLVTFFFNKERYQISEEDKYQGVKHYWKELRILFQNWAFVTVTMIYLCCWLAINFITNNFFLYMKYVLEMEDHFGYLLLVIQGTAAAFLPLWNLVSHLVGKKTTYYIGMSFWMVVQIGLYFVTADTHTAVVYAIGFLAGIGIAIGFLIPWSMLPDVIELDELQTNKRREGMFYAIFTLFQKLTLAAGLAASSFALGLAGYKAPKDDLEDEVTQQPESVLYTLRVMIGPLPAFVLLLSFVAVWFYPITKQKHEEIKREIAAKRREIHEHGQSKQG